MMETTFQETRPELVRYKDMNAIEIGIPIWLVIPALLFLVLGGVKLVKLFLMGR